MPKSGEHRILGGFVYYGAPENRMAAYHGKIKCIECTCTLKAPKLYGKKNKSGGKSLLELWVNTFLPD